MLGVSLLGIFGCASTQPATGAGGGSPLAVRMEPETYHAVLTFKDLGKDLFSADAAVLRLDVIKAEIPAAKVGRKTWEVSLTGEQTEMQRQACANSGRACTGKLAVLSRAAGPSATTELPVSVDVRWFAVVRTQPRVFLPKTASSLGDGKR
jgi:hypothetical protein